MLRCVPGQVSTAYLRALKEIEIRFWRSLTMSDEKAKWVQENYPIDGRRIKVLKGG